MKLTTNKLIEITENANNALLTPAQCANILPDVCEHALALEKKVRNLEARLADFERREENFARINKIIK